MKTAYKFLLSVLVAFALFGIVIGATSLSNIYLKDEDYQRARNLNITNITVKELQCVENACPFVYSLNGKEFLSTTPRYKDYVNGTGRELTTEERRTIQMKIIEKRILSMIKVYDKNQTATSTREIVVSSDKEKV